MSGYFKTFKSPWNHKDRERHPWRATSKRRSLCFPTIINWQAKQAIYSRFAYLYYCMSCDVLLEKKYPRKFIGIGMSQLFHAQKLSGPFIKYIHTWIKQKWLTMSESTVLDDIDCFTSCGKRPWKLWLKIVHKHFNLTTSCKHNNFVG